MAITPKNTFDAALARPRHLLALYDVLHDSRKRSARKDWKRSFCNVMHWPVTEDILRIDGANGNSMLVLRESVNMSRQSFTHHYLSELLRGAITASVSALDKYIHDQIVNRSPILLKLPEDQIPSELRKLKLPALTVKRSLEKLKKDSKSRPSSILKKDMQEMLQRDETFQSVSGVEKGARILGLKDFWRSMVTEIGEYSNPGALKEDLSKITRRRNQIVHEADTVPQQKAQSVKLREISRADAEFSIEFIDKFVNAMDIIIND